MTFPASSGGAPSASSGGAPSPGASGPGDSGGADGVDFKEAFQSQRGELEKTRGELRSIGTQFKQFQGETAKKTSILDKLKGVLSGEGEDKGPKIDPFVTETEAQLDYYLEQAVQAERDGRPMPLTTNLAVKSFQHQLEWHKEKTELRGQINQLMDTVKQLQNPGRQLDHNTFAGLDAELIGALDGLYGSPGVVTPQKQAQFQAISGQVASSIQEIREKAPAQWDRIRRDPAMQKRLVEAVVRQNLPPQAVRMIEQQKLQNTEMSTEELWSAFREGAQIENPAQRAEIRGKIREQIIGRMLENKSKRR